MSNIEKNIPEEQPPAEIQDLVEWLSRLVIQINGALSNTQDFTPIGKLPDTVYEGMSVFFNQAILPDITHAGPWVYVQGQWRSMI